jgi:hypothetical protein
VGINSLEEKLKTFFIKSLFVLSSTNYVSNPEHSCALPLGMEDKRIPDNAITASYRYSSYNERYARLNDGKAWCTRKIGGQYLQIDLGEVKTITRVATQGWSGGYWTKKYFLEYSIDGLHWAYYRKYGTAQKVSILNHSP